MVEALNTALRRVPPGLVYAGGLGWMAWMFWLAATGGLGPEPVKALEHAYGKAALQWLLAGLAVTPLRVWTGINAIRLRRSVGLVAFALLAGHFAVWAVLDVQSLERVWADIVKRPYITVGMAGLLLLVPLALTSNDRAVRRLGARWRGLHRLVYPAVALGALHYVWQSKGWQVEPLVYAVVVAALLALRLPAVSRRGKRLREALG